MIQTASAQFYRVVLKDIDPTGTYESMYRYLRLLRKSKVKMFDCLGKRELRAKLISRLNINKTDIGMWFVKTRESIPCRSLGFKINRFD